MLNMRGNYFFNVLINFSTSYFKKFHLFYSTYQFSFGQANKSFYIHYSLHEESTDFQFYSVHKTLHIHQRQIRSRTTNTNICSSVSNNFKTT